MYKDALFEMPKLRDPSSCTFEEKPGN